MAATDHASPMPKKTLTALLPVTLPMEASAYTSWTAAALLAKVSERERRNEGMGNKETGRQQCLIGAKSYHW